ncbi:MAG: MGMT family protein [Candidatus Aenigmarchaeota archaeon]|nr:MGMT family protein [Candidatus Aenigmarchaeota archaeon]
MPDEKITQFKNKVYNATKQIPKGKVTTYKEIAKAIGKPRSYRAIGNALNKNPFAPKIPCHRVIRSDGSIGGFAYGTQKKIRLLKSEGIKINNKGFIRHFRNFQFHF